MTADTKIAYSASDRGPFDFILDSWAAIGGSILHLLETIGRLSIFIVRSLAGVFHPPWFPRLIVRQLIDIGYYSLPVVGMTALSSGATGVALEWWGARYLFTYIGIGGGLCGVAGLCVARELRRAQ